MTNWQNPIDFDLYQLDLFLSGNQPLPGLAVNGPVAIVGTLTLNGVPVGSGGGTGGISGLTGDVLASGLGSVTATLATVNANVGTFGSTSQCPTITVNAKGLITAISQSTSCPGSSVVATTLVGTLASQAPAGATNGTNAVFTLANAPSPTLSLQLAKNGITQTPGIDYSLSGATVTFLAGSIPQATDTIWAWYTFGAGTIFASPSSGTGLLEWSATTPGVTTVATPANVITALGSSATITINGVACTLNSTCSTSGLTASGAAAGLLNWNPTTPNVATVATAANVLSALGSNATVTVNGVACVLGSTCASGITALTGDVTASGAGSDITVLATVNSTTGTFGDASHCASFTVNAKGLVTSSSQSTTCPGGGGGGSGIPGGTNGQFQIDNAGSFGGVSITGGPISIAATGLSLSRDEQNALDLGNKTSTGIAAAVAACAALSTTSCVIDVPSGYPATEIAPGSGTVWFSAGTGGNIPNSVTGMRNGTIIQDHRVGEWQWSYNVVGDGSGNTHTKHQENCIYDDIGGLLTASLTTCNVENMVVLGGGFNVNNFGSLDKTNWQTSEIAAVFYGDGQHITTGESATCYSGWGDCIAKSSQVYTSAGINTGTDEGDEDQDSRVAPLAQENAGTFTSASAALSPASIVVNETTAAGTVGQSRFVIETTEGTFSGGLLASLANTGGGQYPTATFTGASFPVDVVEGTLGTTVEPPVGTVASYTVTPHFTRGSISNITTTTGVCVTDQGNQELVYPTSVNIGAGTFVAPFNWWQLSTASISVGGVGCYGLDIHADDETSSFQHSTYQIQAGYLSSQHKVMPLIGSPTSTTVTIYMGGGIYSLLGMGGNHAYTIYPMAQVHRTDSGGKISNTWTLWPSVMPAHAGDAYFVPNQYSQRISHGTQILESYSTGIPFGATGMGYTYNMPLSYNDTMFSLINNGTPSMYTGNGGPLYPPAGITIQGDISWGVTLNTTPSTNLWAFGVGCPDLMGSTIAATCTKSYPMLAAANGDGGHDYFIYQQVAGSENWQLTTGNFSGADYNFLRTGLAIDDGNLAVFPSNNQNALEVDSTALYGLVFNKPPSNAAILLQCASPCTSQASVIQVQNAASFDSQLYNETYKEWQLTAQSGAGGTYTFGGNIGTNGVLSSEAFTTPFPYAAIGMMNNQSYVAATNFLFSNVGASNGSGKQVCSSATNGLVSQVYWGTNASTIQLCTNTAGGYAWVNTGMGLENINYAAAIVLDPNVPTSQISLAGNVTSITFSSTPPSGTKKTLIFCQDTTGGRTVTGAPANLVGFTAITNTTPNTCASQTWTYLNVGNFWMPQSVGIQGITP